MASENEPHGAMILKAPDYPFLVRLKLWIDVWFKKAVVVLVYGVLRSVKRKTFREIAPTYVKRYSVNGTSLQARVFIPEQSKSSQSLPPLYLDIHGGGFTIGDPQLDDRFCHRFSNTYGYCIVSMQYRMAPRYPFPTPINDLVALANAILDDDSIPGDRTRVAIGGFSAGGNLTFAVSQHQSLKNRISALLSFYPVTDFSGKHRQEPIQKQVGKHMEPTRFWDFSYVPTGHSLTDPLLSPVFASRSDLPKSIFLLGCGLDPLCHEAEELAKILASQEPNSSSRKGSDDAWDQGTIAWRKIQGVKHAFDQMPAKTDEAKKKKDEATDYMVSEAAAWLERHMPFASPSVDPPPAVQEN